MTESLFFSIISQTGFANLTVGHVVMWIIGLTLIYLAIKKEFEPLLLLPIGFAIFAINFPLVPLIGENERGVKELFKIIHYYGIEWELLPPLIFL
ncbi:MAG: sodium ion-translocating decarboxylase subunit beta, partial [Thermodesulfobacteriota bacterium]